MSFCQYHLHVSKSYKIYSKNSITIQPYVISIQGIKKNVICRSCYQFFNVKYQLVMPVVTVNYSTNKIGEGGGERKINPIGLDLRSQKAQSSSHLIQVGRNCLKRRTD